MSSAAQYTYNTIQPYDAPSWARGLRCQPTAYVQLAVRPTPIHRWELPGVPSGFQVFVKRDDLTGSTLTGNKVRKLEFLLAEALQQGCDSVITCGSIQSNHARATAVAARQLGLQPHLLLRQPSQDATVGCSGNLLLSRLSAAKIILHTVPPMGSAGKGSKHMHMMQEYAEKLKSEGSRPYLIPVGGSNALGSWGYIEAFREMMEQGVLENFDDIVVAAALGGSLGGITIANYLTGSKVKVHGVCFSARGCYRHIDEYLEEYGLKHDAEGKPVKSRDLVDMIEGYQGSGYGVSSEEELAQLTEIFTKTGIALDPVYTLKGVRGLLGQLQNNPGRFAGKRILYIHTGGLFTLYGGTLDKLMKANPSTNQVYDYEDVVGD